MIIVETVAATLLVIAVVGGAGYWLLYQFAKSMSDQG